jgi:hypothetical protein
LGGGAEEVACQILYRRLYGMAGTGLLEAAEP